MALKMRDRRPVNETTLSWKAFVDHVSGLGDRWIYRGGSLVTTFERLCGSLGIAPAARRRLELLLIREFCRHPPARHMARDRDMLGWMAVMQHFRAPTRLLDWTYSPYVAAFFAISDLDGPAAIRRHPSPIWALDADWLETRLRRLLSPRGLWSKYSARRSPDDFADVFLRKPPIAFVGRATPFDLNERLSLQQGVFLCPGDVSRSWLENFAALGKGGALVSFRLRPEDVETALRALDRMNISARTLFPGLDGYGQWVRSRARDLMKGHAPSFEMSGRRVLDAIWMTK
jgi:hypothetical protein